MVPHGPDFISGTKDLAEHLFNSLEITVSDDADSSFSVSSFIQVVSYRKNTPSLPVLHVGAEPLFAALSMEWGNIFFFCHNIN